MDQQLGDAEPGYVSCMFCTARCFKLHGTSQGACAPASTSSREMVLQPGASKERSSSGRKHRAPFFVKTVKITTVRRKNCELHLPAFFFKDYGDRFQKFVLLQGPSGQVWPVNLCVSCGSTTGRPTVRFSRGWKEFANDHRLELGDKLIFTLASFSRFSVQVFDPLGRKKPTSSTAVSGWSFRREEDDDSGSWPQKKSIFVNWQNKVVRESSLGNSAKNGKGQASRVAMLCRHLKRENKTPEKRSSALVAKLRGQSLPLSLLAQKWSSRASSDEVLDDTQADDATNLLEWEPLETASPSQLWPLALKSNHSSKALDSNVLSLTSSPSSPPREGDHDDGDDEDPFQAYWKLHNKRSVISEVATWPTAEKPQILNYAHPIGTLEAPKVIDTPSSPALISISHCLAPVSRSEAAPQPCNVQSSVSQELLGFATSSSTQESVRPEKLSHRISNSEVREAEKNIPPNVQGSVSQELLGFPNSSSLKQESVKPKKLPQRNRFSEAEKSIPSNLQSSVSQELLGFANSSKQASVRIEKLPQRNPEEAANPFREIIDRAPSSRSELEIKTPSRSFANPTPTRSDLSLAYFLHQPRATAQKHEGGASGDLSRLQKPPPVCAQKSQAPNTRIKPQVQFAANSKENIPPGPLVVYNSSLNLDQVPCARSGTSTLPLEKKSRLRVRDCNGLSQAGNLGARRDMVDKFQLDSSSKKRSLEVDSRVVMSEDHLKVRKVSLGGALNLLGKGTSAPQTKVGTGGNRCDLVELDDIASDDDGSDS